MAIYGIKGGNVLDVNLYNNFIDILNFNKVANVVLNSAAGSNNSGTSTKNTFSFYQTRDYLTLVNFYHSRDAIASFIYPRITNSENEDGTAKTYTFVSDSIETINVLNNGFPEFLYILKTKYSTSYRGNIWIEEDVVAGEKNFKANIVQWMAVQHNATETELPKIKKGDLAVTSTYWDPVRTYLNSTEIISFSQNVFDSAGTEQGRSSFFLTFNSDIYLRKMTGYVRARATFAKRNFKDFIVVFNPPLTSVAKTNGHYFENMIMSLSDLGGEDVYFTAQHINFPVKYFYLRSTGAKMSLSSVDLKMLQWVTEGFANLFDGYVDPHYMPSDLTSERLSRYLVARRVLKSDFSFTVGTDIKIYINF